MQTELDHLSFTLNKYDEVIDDTNLKLTNLKKIYKYDYDAMLEEKFKLENEIASLEKAKLKPYFARIDFKSDINDICYIGKKGVIDYDNNIITVDWRAPISSLYYDSNIGTAEYNAPEGIVKGELILKRQYTIEDSHLIGFNDVDTVSNDELLKPYLSASADNRLKNIVSTIQSEQNKIIRENINKNLVIQGVAGSGKTTVALHRIAYLVYNNRDLYKPSDYMVIGPNKFFVSYISSILPDLDVNGVTQNTLDELFLSYVKEDYKIINSLDKITDKDDYSKFRVSLKLKNIIDEYFDNLQIIPNEDLKINNVKIIDKKIILDIYNDLNKNMFESVKSKIERCLLLLNKYIEVNKNQIISKLIKDDVDKKVINELKNNIGTHLKKHFTVLNKKVKNIYIEILNNLNYDTKDINKNIIEVEDIPAMLYIKFKLNGSSEFDKYRHIVIDEAQDYGQFAFYVLKKMFKNATFSIYGDLAQSLYSYRSVSDWKCLNDIFNNLEILKLNKSYRTTIEIMNEANRINELLNLDKAIPVIRHGDSVEHLNKCKINDIIDMVGGLKKRYNTIAIITKSNLEAKKLYVALKDKINLNLITSDNLNYNNDINILPSYLSKGLEFDGVILVDNEFDKNCIIDLKLFYVAMTRALHKLSIVKTIV